MVKTCISCKYILPQWLLNEETIKNGRAFEMLDIIESTRNKSRCGCNHSQSKQTSIYDGKYYFNSCLNMRQDPLKCGCSGDLWESMPELHKPKSDEEKLPWYKRIFLRY